MRKSLSTKLSLSKETLVHLDNTKLAHAAGGYSYIAASDCSYCAGAPVSHSDCPCPPDIQA
ncbi:MAG: class I lanthipeptide [Thermoanaerobaculia bacterium]